MGKPIEGKKNDSERTEWFVNFFFLKEEWFVNYNTQCEKIKVKNRREMLATHILTHIFQHTFFDWLKFTWDPLNLYGTHMIWWNSCEF